MPYEFPQPRNEFEEAVQGAGYPWVQTVRLHPHGTLDAADHPFRIFDRLGRHKHSSENTHLIVTGQLTINTELGDQCTIDAAGDGPKEFPVSSGVYYSGEAGNEGATFVEGHAILSPATADRYERRGVIVWRQKGRMTRNQWLTRVEGRQQAAREDNLIAVDYQHLFGYEY